MAGTQTVPVLVPAVCILSASSVPQGDHVVHPSLCSIARAKILRKSQQASILGYACCRIPRPPGDPWAGSRIGCCHLIPGPSVLRQKDSANVTHCPPLVAKSPCGYRITHDHSILLGGLQSDFHYTIFVDSPYYHQEQISS